MKGAKESSIHYAKPTRGSSSRPTPTRKGISHDICPKTPTRLQVEYSFEQRNYPSIPRLHRPGIVPGFAVEMERNYYK
jgi:hypothetical protein